MVGWPLHTLQLYLDKLYLDNPWARRGTEKEAGKGKAVGRARVAGRRAAGRRAAGRKVAGRKVVGRKVVVGTARGHGTAKVGVARAGGVVLVAAALVVLQTMGTPTATSTLRGFLRIVPCLGVEGSLVGSS